MFETAVSYNVNKSISLPDDFSVVTGALDTSADKEEPENKRLCIPQHSVELEQLPGTSACDIEVDIFFFDLVNTLLGGCTSKSGLTLSLEVEGPAVASVAGSFFKIPINKVHYIRLFLIVVL